MKNQLSPIWTTSIIQLNIVRSVSLWSVQKATRFFMFSAVRYGFTAFECAREPSLVIWWSEVDSGIHAAWVTDCAVRLKDRRICGSVVSSAEQSLSFRPQFLFLEKKYIRLEPFCRESNSLCHSFRVSALCTRKLPATSVIVPRLNFCWSDHDSSSWRTLYRPSFASCFLLCSGSCSGLFCRVFMNFLPSGRRFQK